MTVYSIHIIHKDTGDRIYTSVAFLNEELEEMLGAVTVNYPYVARLYDIMNLKYINEPK